MKYYCIDNILDQMRHYIKIFWLTLAELKSIFILKISVLNFVSYIRNLWEHFLNFKPKMDLVHVYIRIETKFKTYTEFSSSLWGKGRLRNSLLGLLFSFQTTTQRSWKKLPFLVFFFPFNFVSIGDFGSERFVHKQLLPHNKCDILWASVPSGWHYWRVERSEKCVLSIHQIPYLHKYIRELNTMN